MFLETSARSFALTLEPRTNLPLEEDDPIEAIEAKGETSILAFLEAEML